MSRLVDPRSRELDWKRAFDMADAITDASNDVSTQPTLGLIRGELKLGDADDDTMSNASRASGYREYVLQRTLGMKAMLTAATTAATCKDPRRRCAVGRALAEPKNPRSLFATFAKRATREGADAFLRGCEEDVRAIEDALTEEDVARTKNFYGAHVKEAHFDYLENQARKCAERAASSSASSGFIRVVPVVVPNMDVVVDDADDDDSDSAGGAMVFGKKSKKKRNKKSGGGGGAGTSAAAASMVSSILAEGKALAAEDALRVMAEKFGSTEPAFPEIQAWGQTTSSEAAAVVLSILARAPAGCAVVLPSNLMASTLTFGVRDPNNNAASDSLDTVGFVANTSGALAFSIDAVARPQWRETNPNVSSAVWISFDDDDDADDKNRGENLSSSSSPPEDAAITKSALSALKSSKIPVTIAAFTLARGARECDAFDGPPDAVALGAAASARAHERVASALGDDDDDDDE